MAAEDAINFEEAGGVAANAPREVGMQRARVLVYFAVASLSRPARESPFGLTSTPPSAS